MPTVAQNASIFFSYDLYVLTVPTVLLCIGILWYTLSGSAHLFPVKLMF
jgi:hypothetical protein